MKSALYTWGTGAAWGRDLGCLPTDKKARNHTSLSILAGEGESQTHFLIDVGVPCVESMIDAVQDGNVPIPPPDAVFITHPHFDHNADLTKLCFSRESGWIRRYSYWTLTDEFFDDCQQMLSEEAVLALREMKTADPEELRHTVSDHADIAGNTWKKSYVGLIKTYPPPLPVVATSDCIDDPRHGIRKQFGFVQDKLLWQITPEFDVWYAVRKESGTLVSWAEICTLNPESAHPILFKSLPVWHGPGAPGACLYIFRILDDQRAGTTAGKTVVISGDFATMDESVIRNRDMKNPDLLLIETNTVYTENDTHTNWIKNKNLISRWFTKEHEGRILLYHLSSSYDWVAGYAPRPMTDTDWREVCRDEDFNDYRLEIDIAEDGRKYEL